MTRASPLWIRLASQRINHIIVLINSCVVVSLNSRLLIVKTRHLSIFIHQCFAPTTLFSRKILLSRWFLSRWFLSRWLLSSSSASLSSLSPCGPLHHQRHSRLLHLRLLHLRLLHPRLLHPRLHHRLQTHHRLRTHHRLQTHPRHSLRHPLLLPPMAAVAVNSRLQYPSWHHHHHYPQTPPLQQPHPHHPFPPSQTPVPFLTLIPP